MVTVRPATVDDCDAIADVHVRTWQAAYAHAMPAAYLAGLEAADRATMWRRSIGGATGPSAVLVAAVDNLDGSDGKIAGFAAVGRFRNEDGSRDETTGEVYAIYVAPEHWSTGAGLALMGRAVDHLTGHGLSEIRLWVLADNPRARRFYERFGFVADGAVRVEPAGAGYDDARLLEEVRYTLPVR
jgi:ribosomal protein S18 acetylase RimI-like enzyme